MGSTSEDAFNGLLDAVKSAAEVYKGPLGAVNARERAESYRHALRVLSVAMEQIVEKGDRERPDFTRWVSPTRKLMGDNPHTIYDACYIDATRRYRIRGLLGEATYVGICVYGTDEEGFRRIVNNIDDAEMVLDDDGTFEVYLSATKPDGAKNWLELEPDSTDVMVRQYFLDRDNQLEAAYDIEPLPHPGAPPPLTEEAFAARCAQASVWVRECMMAEQTVSALSMTTTPQQLRDGVDIETTDDDDIPIDMDWVAKLMPSPSILYSGNWVNDLGDDEVLVIEGTPPRARYWSLQVLSRWMESIDYRYHEAIFTQHNTKLEDDGRFRIVLSQNDPGEKNWLQTAGLQSCNVIMRAVRPESEDDDLDVEFRREAR